METPRPRCGARCVAITAFFACGLLAYMFLVGVHPVAVTLEGDLFEATPTVAASKTAAASLGSEVVSEGTGPSIPSPSVVNPSALPPSPFRRTGCLPFDDREASLADGYWHFSNPNITLPDCVREFHMSSNGSQSQPACDLRRITVEEARTCLRGKHLLFVGDSVTRHQFESLVIWIETGQRSVQYTANPSPYTLSFPEPHDHGNCGGVIRCEAERSNHTEMYENRYYRNTELDINISTIGIYAFGFGHGPVGWAPPGTPFSPEFEWSFSTLTGIARGIKKWFGTVDALQVNVGVWGNPMIRPTTYEVLKHFTKGDVEAAKDELREMQGAVKEGGAIWATTTLLNGEDASRMRDGAPLAEVGARLGSGYLAARELGWKILDRNGITRQLQSAMLGTTTNGGKPFPVMTDLVHYYPFVNDEMNNVLLNMLC